MSRPNTEDRPAFARLLEAFRRQQPGRVDGHPLSRYQLALRVGIDPSYLARIEQGDREPPHRHIVEAICRGLQLDPAGSHQLLAAAGYWPYEFEWNEQLEVMADLLRIGDERVTMALASVALLSSGYVTNQAAATLLGIDPQPEAAALPTPAEPEPAAPKPPSLWTFIGAIPHKTTDWAPVPTVSHHDATPA